ncbi:MAG TPA: hypothetical protein VFX30_04340 [bacterium]|nr:hypothetical protein [bacterium]
MTKTTAPKKISRTQTRSQVSTSPETQKTSDVQTNKITRVALNDSMSLDFGPNPKKILSLKFKF